MDRASLPTLAALSAADHETLPVWLRHMDHLPLLCRVVGAGGRVLWQSRALQERIPAQQAGDCCGSLGLQHRDATCPSTRTLTLGLSQKRVFWLGKLYLSLETVPLQGDDEEGIVSFECLTDVTTEKRLEGALTQQQELLEDINKAMIEINHHLESAQKELEAKNESLEVANRRLRSLDQMKDDFISIVSHELKAPLTSIKGSVELVQLFEKDKISPKGAELLTICQRNTDRLNRLILDLLDISRIESGRMSLFFSCFNVAEMVTECLQSMKTPADQKGLVLKAILPEGLNLEADRERVVQVVVNLLSNAIKFTDQGSVEVEAMAESGHITLVVRDTGVGIPPEDQAKVFEKFEQVGFAFHRKSGGTGLGLSIARGIIREHGGDIVVESEPGRGSSFTVRIPQPPVKNERRLPGPLD